MTNPDSGLRIMALIKLLSLQQLYRFRHWLSINKCTFTVILSGTLDNIFINLYLYPVFNSSDSYTSNTVYLQSMPIHWNLPVALVYWIFNISETLKVFNLCSSLRHDHINELLSVTCRQTSGFLLIFRFFVFALSAFFLISCVDIVLLTCHVLVLLSCWVIT